MPSEIGWTPSKGSKAKAPPLEVPPQDPPRRRRARQVPLDDLPPVPPIEETKPPDPSADIQAKDVEAMVIVSMQFLATTVDESFTVLDSNMKPLPRVKEAVSEMMPWIRLYGGSVVKLFPWFGFASGILMLTAPAFDPCAEIIAGVRKPRFARKSADDIYTDAWKRAQAKRAAGAAGQTVEATATKSQDKAA